MVEAAQEAWRHKAGFGTSLAWLRPSSVCTFLFVLTKGKIMRNRRTNRSRISIRPQSKPLEGRCFAQRGRLDARHQITRQPESMS